MYEVPVSLRNLDVVTRNIKVVLKDSPCFSVAGRTPSGTKVAPGMEVTFIIRFIPDQQKVSFFLHSPPKLSFLQCTKSPQNSLVFVCSLRTIQKSWFVWQTERSLQFPSEQLGSELYWIFPTGSNSLPHQSRFIFYTHYLSSQEVLVDSFPVVACCHENCACEKYWQNRGQIQPEDRQVWWPHGG